VGDLVDLASNVNIIAKSGAWYAYNNEKIGQGRENAKLFLVEHPEILEEIDRKVREHFGLAGAAEASGAGAPTGETHADPED
jgi:recombination protein RecA